MDEKRLETRCLQLVTSCSTGPSGRAAWMLHGTFKAENRTGAQLQAAHPPCGSSAEALPLPLPIPSAFSF